MYLTFKQETTDLLSVHWKS